MEDQLGGLLMQMPTLTGVTYGLTFALGKGIPFLKKIPQATLALPIGIVTSVGGYAVGVVNTGVAEGAAAWGLAGGLGLAGAAMAGVIQDKVVKPLMPSNIKKNGG